MLKNDPADGKRVLKMGGLFSKFSIKSWRKQVGEENPPLSLSLSALRTKSYAEFFTKAQLLVQKEPSSPSYNCHHKFSHEILLEHVQEKIPTILESAILSKVPELKGLILNYFDISAEASKICSHLLQSINQIQHNYQFIQRALDAIDDYSSPESVKMIISELRSFIILNNPFSNPNRNDFKLIDDKYSLVLHHLKLKRKKVARKIKLIKYIHKASGVCITAACGLVAITAIALAAHTLTALFMGPAVFNFPIKRLKNKLFKYGFFRSGFLRKVGEQLDVAAKGTYILNRDFDTMSRLVARLHDDVEHNKAMIQFCLEGREHKFSLQLLKELKKCDTGFRKQVEKLEEHCTYVLSR